MFLSGIDGVLFEHYPVRWYRIDIIFRYYRTAVWDRRLVMIRGEHHFAFRSDSPAAREVLP